MRDPLLKLTAGVAQARMLDEILLEDASPYGPVQAIGDPTEGIPPLGAARIFCERRRLAGDRDFARRRRAGWWCVRQGARERTGNWS